MAHPRLSFDALETFITCDYGPDDEIVRGNLPVRDGRQQTDGRIAMLCGVSRSAVLRWRRDGRVPFETADTIAIRLGSHPGIIWDNYYAGTLHPCGTLGAALRHKRNGERLCDECRPVWNDYMRPYIRAWERRQRAQRAIEAGRIPGQPGRQKGVRQRPLAPCGTTAGEARHRRDGEEVCAACKEAKREYNAWYRAQKRVA